GMGNAGADMVLVGVAGGGRLDGRTDTPYLDRLHVLRMTVDVGAPFPNVQTTLVDTRLLKTAGNDNLVGSAYAFNGANAEKSRRFDPEGVAIGRDGTIFVSDEYGPSILAFDRQGQLASRVAVPEKFLLAPPPFGHPSGDVDGNGNALELYPALNVFGRQANRGLAARATARRPPAGRPHAERPAPGPRPRPGHHPPPRTEQPDPDGGSPHGRDARVRLRDGRRHRGPRRRRHPRDQRPRVPCHRARQPHELADAPEYGRGAESQADLQDRSRQARAHRRVRGLFAAGERRGPGRAVDRARDQDALHQPARRELQSQPDPDPQGRRRGEDRGPRVGTGSAGRPPPPVRPQQQRSVRGP